MLHFHRYRFLVLHMLFLRLIVFRVLITCYSLGARAGFQQTEERGGGEKKGERERERERDPFQSCIFSRDYSRACHPPRTGLPRKSKKGKKVCIAGRRREREG